ncbi:hypothetical protein ACSFA8_00830 [Variovorax sp. RT4R15]|uniref:hypothetical protein n=1 Tax=Variovorax sp. RT4R15 TaxID=3443737 RepID=UPI003F477091
MRPTFLPIRPTAVCALALSGLLGCSAAQAYLVGIAPGPRALYLQVGTGTFTGTYRSGGTPGDNSTVNTVTATIAAGAIGSGAQTMSTNSTVANSPYDNFAFCTPGTGQVYVGGFYRVPGTSGASATLSVTTPPNLLNASSDTIPFSTISWVSGGSGDATATIPSGTFAGTPAQPLLSVALNNWFESCLTFSYANAQLAPAGTFTGRATYQLVAP